MYIYTYIYINNCVGAGNHRFFLLFLFWVSLACFYVAVCCYVDICDMLVSARVGRVEGTQFPCFTGTKVQILTPEELQ